jgi:D-arabinose 5-phosphate isomerase GutQ
LTYANIHVILTLETVRTKGGKKVRMDFSKAEQSFLAAGKRAFALEADCLSQAFSRLDESEFLRAVDALARAPRIGASGCGHSGIACRHFAHLMCCIGRPARFLSPSEAAHGAMGFLSEGDVMLLASRGGKTAELMPFPGICRKRGVTVIAVTENTDSPLCREADLVLRMFVTCETDRYNSQGTTSFAALSALFDALQAALIEKTDFQNAEFAEIHPGGAVGERLRPLSAAGENQIENKEK